MVEHNENSQGEDLRGHFGLNFRPPKYATDFQKSVHNSGRAESPVGSKPLVVAGAIAIASLVLYLAAGVAFVAWLASMTVVAAVVALVYLPQMVPEPISDRVVKRVWLQNNADALNSYVRHEYEHPPVLLALDEQDNKLLITAHDQLGAVDELQKVLKRIAAVAEESHEVIPVVVNGQEFADASLAMQKLKSIDLLPSQRITGLPDDSAESIVELSAGYVQTTQVPIVGGQATRSFSLDVGPPGVDHITGSLPTL